MQCVACRWGDRSEDVDFHDCCHPSAFFGDTKKNQRHSWWYSRTGSGAGLAWMSGPALKQNIEAEEGIWYLCSISIVSIDHWPVDIQSPACSQRYLLCLLDSRKRRLAVIALFWFFCFSFFIFIFYFLFFSAKPPAPHDHHCCTAAGTNWLYCLLISLGCILPLRYERMNLSKYRSIMCLQ